MIWHLIFDLGSIAKEYLICMHCVRIANSICRAYNGVRIWMNWDESTLEVKC